MLLVFSEMDYNFGMEEKRQFLSPKIGENHRKL
jgi:hypothetical protein